MFSWSMESLVALTLLASIASMLLSCAALWPHSKDGMSSIRDAILWGAFIFVVSGAATVGWKRLNTLGPYQPVVHEQSTMNVAAPVWSNNLVQPVKRDPSIEPRARIEPFRPIYGVDSTRQTNRNASF